jgi:tRNA-specific 2-thiouridylase
MKIAIALSGGVDSSFAAYKLQKEGNYVEAFTFKANSIFNTERASYVAEVLGIKHHIIDISKEFNDKIINYFIKSYLKGYTPNPCAICNRIIKSDIFINKINKYKNFDYYASGHYVRKGKYKNSIVLKEHEDKHKSQTYFLSLIKKDSLKPLIFPLADYNKTIVKKTMLSEFSEIFNREKESFEICFIKDIKYYNFIRKKIKEKGRKGVFKNEKGEILGNHSGFYKYTIGQRRGLRIAQGERIYVYDTDPLNNIVYVGKEENLYKNYFFIKNPNWFYLPSNNEVFFVRTRYNGKLTRVKSIEYNNDKIKINLTEQLKAITPGQLASFYIGDNLIGGGIIERFSR